MLDWLQPARVRRRFLKRADASNLVPFPKSS